MKKLLFDIESEKVLLNQIINDGAIFNEVKEKINKECFYNSNYHKVFELLEEINKVQKIDFINFTTEFKKSKMDNKIYDEITSDCIPSSTWEYYADNILKSYQARKLQNLLVEQVEKINGTNASEIISNLTPCLTDIDYMAGEMREETQLERMIELLPMIENMIKNPNYSKGYMTGLNNLDSIIMGIHNELVIISARASMGKTAFAQKLALKFAEKEKVNFIELEMSHQQINLRNVAILSGLRLNDIKYGTIRGDERKIARVQNAMDILASGAIGANYKITEPKNRNIQTIINYIRRDVLRNGTKIVFVDHIGLIKSENGNRQHWESVAEISHEFQKLQRELNIPIILLAQRGRESEGGNQKGNMATIRGSGAIEEDADLILMIEHARATDKKEQEKRGAESENIDAQIYVSKNRNGSCGVANVIFRPAHINFCDKLEK